MQKATRSKFSSEEKIPTIKIVGVLVVVIGLGLLSYKILPRIFSIDNTSNVVDTRGIGGDSNIKDIEYKDDEIKKVIVAASHIPTPEVVKAIYMTSWVAGTKSIRDGLIKLIEDKEINSIMIDIKDYTGSIAYKPLDEDLLAFDTYENRISDLSTLIEELHSKNIYVMGRVAAFQDPKLVKLFPEDAVKKASDGSVWKDYKGISWIDAGSKKTWDYLIMVAKDAHKQGFDEINFDYIRFPSDGNMRDIYYPLSEGKIKSDVMREFYTYVSAPLKEEGIVLSADLFGMTTTNYDDLNIGQVLEDALIYFDYIAPMVYPSHYPKTFLGYANPAEYPYEVVYHSMSTAVQRAKLASTTSLKLRPWLQDFDLGADYDATMVRKQIDAVYDSGLTSWMLWAASNKYTKGALIDNVDKVVEIEDNI